MTVVRWLLVWDENHEAIQSTAVEIARANKEDREDDPNVPELTHVGLPVRNAAEALKRLREESVDVVLIDLGLPPPDGGHASRDEGTSLALEIHDSWPDTNILIFSINPIDSRSRAECSRVKVLHNEAHVMGYLFSMAMSHAKYAQAIVAAAEGQPTYILGVPFHHWQKCLNAPAHLCFDRVDPLTPAEHAAMVYLARDTLTTGEIAAKLSVVEDSVVRYLADARAKLGDLPDRVALVRWAFTNCPDCCLYDVDRIAPDQV